MSKDESVFYGVRIKTEDIDGFGHLNVELWPTAKVTIEQDGSTRAIPFEVIKEPATSTEAWRFVGGLEAQTAPKLATVSMFTGITCGPIEDDEPCDTSSES